MVASKSLLRCRLLSEQLRSTSSSTALYSRRRIHSSTSLGALSSKAQTPIYTDGDLAELLKRYSNFPPSPLTIRNFLDFGREGTPHSSFLFLRHELPVRLANIVREIQFLPKELLRTRGCIEIFDQYRQSFADIVAFSTRKCRPDDAQVHSDFTDRVAMIRDRHSELVTVMAQAVYEVKNEYTVSRSQHGKLPKFERNIQYFLDRLYTSRMSTRMLINQHILLFGNDRHKQKCAFGDTTVGAIDPDCQILPLIEKAYESARFLSEQYYMTAPNLTLTSYDLTMQSKDTILSDQSRVPITCVQIPSHLYHILFELFKNAMRASIEHHGEDAKDHPPVQVVVAKTQDDVTIQISDRGGGINRKNIGNVFQYLYTTAPNPVVTMSSGESSRMAELGQQSVPLAGYGYGLPLSRLYAR